MGVSDRLAGQDTEYDPETVEVGGAEVLELLEPVVQKWWLDEFASSHR